MPDHDQRGALHLWASPATALPPNHATLSSRRQSVRLGRAVLDAPSRSRAQLAKAPVEHRVVTRVMAENRRRAASDTCLELWQWRRARRWAVRVETLAAENLLEASGASGGHVIQRSAAVACVCIARGPPAPVLCFSSRGGGCCVSSRRREAHKLAEGPTVAAARRHRSGRVCVYNCGHMGAPPAVLHAFVDSLTCKKSVVQTLQKLPKTLSAVTREAD